MRAGRPWNATRSPARRIQRWSGSSSGKSSPIARSIAAMSAGLPGERGPPEGPLPLAEQRADVRRHETRDLERVVDARVQRLAAQVVAVVERHRALAAELEHRAAVNGHRVHRPPHVLVGVVRPELGRFRETQARGHVTGQGVVRARLIGKHVGNRVAAHDLGEDLGAVPGEADRYRFSGRGRRGHAGEGGIQVGGDLVEVAARDAALEARAVDLHDQACRAVHGGRERLRAPHPPAAPCQDPAARERSVEVPRRDGGEGFVGSLEDPLRADVDPRARRHLAVHRQAEPLEAAELVRRGPARNEVRVGDQNSRGHGVGAEDADRLPRLNAEGLVVLQILERRDDRLEAFPAPCGAARAAVHDQPVGIFGDLRIEVVHQHPERRLLVPAAAPELRAARRAHRSRPRGGHGIGHRILLGGAERSECRECVPRLSGGSRSERNGNGGGPKTSPADRPSASRRSVRRALQRALHDALDQRRRWR